MVLLWGLAIVVYVVLVCNDATKAVSDLVHAHFKDVLANLQAKGHVQEPVYPFLGTEYGEV